MSREQQIRDRVAAATPGDWKRDQYDDPGMQVVASGNEVVAYHTFHQRQVDRRVVPNYELFAHSKADLTYLLDRVKELEDALEIVNNGVDDFGGSYVNLQVQMSEVEEGRAVLAKRNL